MEARRILSFREARSLENEARAIQRKIYRSTGNGIQPGEARNIERRIRHLEIRVQREATDFNNRPGYRRY
jgi:cystathionine beta-lyase/cystathionine gamma-synthase